MVNGEHVYAGLPQSNPNFIDNFYPLFSLLISQVSSLVNELLFYAGFVTASVVLLSSPHIFN
jgi:hypothetical protein|tara:strand:- start:961 stop:1146 length:186 start_codon:yes stop_codon:yes gene_type:complete